MSSWIRNGCFTLALMLLASPVAAQLTVGENLSLKASGNLGFGFSGANSSGGSSGRSTSFAGSGSITGHYYHPNFLSFNIQPFYHRAASASAVDSRLSDKGVLSTVNFFSGSRFPGTISYSRESNSMGEFGLPGVGSLTTEGGSQSFSASWSLLVPKFPTLEAGYGRGSSSASIAGVDDGSSSKSSNWNLNSSYILKGFNFRGYLNDTDSEATIPAFLGIGSASSSLSNTMTYGVQVGRMLPMSTSFAAAWDRNKYSSRWQDNEFGGGTTDNFYTSVSMTPSRRLALAADARHTRNLIGAFTQRELGGRPGILAEDRDSHSSSISTSVGLEVFRGLGVQGHVSRRWQTYYGQQIAATQYGGTVNFSYSRPLFGMLRFSVGLVDTATQHGNQGLGAHGSVGMSRRFGRWETGADFSYSQNVQTLVGIYNTSNYTYGGNLRRKLNPDLHWGASVRFARSGLTLREGESNHSESYSSSLHWRKYTVTGTYAQSAGAAVLNAAGILQPVDIVIVSPENFVFHGGRALGVGFSATPVKRLALTMHYTRTSNNTRSIAAASLNEATRFDARAEYKLRRLSMRGGFHRIDQSVSAISATPIVVNSYYFGISRWFDVF